MLEERGLARAGVAQDDEGGFPVEGVINRHRPGAFGRGQHALKVERFLNLVHLAPGQAQPAPGIGLGSGGTGVERDEDRLQRQEGGHLFNLGHPFEVQVLVGAQEVIGVRRPERGQVRRGVEGGDLEGEVVLIAPGEPAAISHVHVSTDGAALQIGRLIGHWDLLDFEKAARTEVPACYGKSVTNRLKRTPGDR